MTLTQLIQIGTIPAALIVLAGMLIRRAGPTHAAGRRFLLFLMGASAVLLLAMFIAGWLTPANDNRPGFLVATLLAPAALGVLALILVFFKELAGSTRGEWALAVLLGLAIVALLVSVGEQPFGMAYALVPGAFLLAVVWVLGRRFEVVAAALSLALLALYNLAATGPLADSDSVQQFPTWLLQSIGILLFFVLPGLAVAVSAVLVSTGFNRLWPPKGDGQPGSARASLWPATWRLALAITLVGCLAYTIVWASIWDQTSDGLAGISLATLAGLVAVAAGVIVTATSNGWRRRLAGLAFAMLVPLGVFEAFTYGWEVSYHALTEARAARIQNAVERFHARTGSYPAELGELIPGDLLWVPEPVILRGQGWCYQGGSDYYRLGAAYREYFSTPLSIRLYASAGVPPEAAWACEEKLAELKAHYDPPPFAGAPPSAP